MWRSINRWFAVAVLVTLAFPAQARDRSRDPVPRNIGSWFSQDDYPAPARRRKQTGAVRFDVTVGVDGKPESCRVIESSTWKVLDDQTCLLVMERSQFDPARDSKGNPVRGDYVQRTRWVLEDGPPTVLTGPFRQAGVIRIDAAGKSSSCTDEPPIGPVPRDFNPACKDMVSGDDDVDILMMLRGGSAGPPEVAVTFEMSFVPDGAKAPAMTYLGAARTRISLQIVHFDLDADGKAINCRTIEKTFSPMDLCGDDLPGPFKVPAGSPRGVTVTMAVSRPAGE